ncbi:MAG: NAD-glutamate dehydrogenase [Fulvimonas sp.]|nr:NAD-glutamate dehydrogenase [Fulvimonas sp.]
MAVNNGDAIPAQVIEALRQHALPAPAELAVPRFVAAFFAQVGSSDRALHEPADWARRIADLLAFLQQRESGRASVRIVEAGEAASLVEVVTDDMPFLVDTVSMTIAEHTQIQLLIHPVIKVRRDAAGRLEAIGEGAPESVMYLEIDPIGDAAQVHALVRALEDALADVRAAVTDWAAMRERALAIADELPRRRPPLEAAVAEEAGAFLRWLAHDNYTFLGFREYVVAADGGSLQPREGTGLGILRGGERSLGPRSLRLGELAMASPAEPILLTKTNARSRVHRPGHMDYVGVLHFDADGRPVAEQRFLGLFTSSAYMARPQDIPLVRQKVEAVLTRSGFERDSYSGKSLRHILETLPRDELLQAGAEELYEIALGILELQQRARPRLFVRADRYGRFFACLVYVPRERFSTTVRERIVKLLSEALHGEEVDSAVWLDESVLARLYVVVRPRIGDRPAFDVATLERGVVDIVRNWHDGLRDSLVRMHGQVQGLALFKRYGRRLPAGYVEEVSPQDAAADLTALAALRDPDALHVKLYRGSAGDLRFKVIHFGAPIPLSEALPMLENMGVRVLAEHVYALTGDEREITIHDFELSPKAAMAFDVLQLAERFERAFEALWRGQAESDGFNNLVLAAHIDWRQVAMLRGYCKYLLQTGVTFSQAYMEDALGRYPAIAGLLVELFLAKFDPRRESLSAAEREAAAAALGTEMRALIPQRVQQAQPELIESLVGAFALPRAAQVEQIGQGIERLLEEVSSLDDDRILRRFSALMHATLRTSYFQTTDGRPRPYISYKFDSHQVPELPKPVPYREIFVYAPRVEGIHLRFGPVARGGLRWSDRREDFRTEVLGLVKAQMVKNTVIVPVGSKGGFYVKRPPAGGDRDAIQAEGVACYRLFINGLLDITDNIVEGKVVPPRDVVRHDADDPYLVVAADKGTATFSDIANAIALEHGFWLGDAFASGGSHGYDHKAMGITARGAWESVKRHFRALGRDCQNEDFTVVGIGDMSGDVFGNGMLLSRHIKLIAAFDHRHVFVDPDPDPARSFAERERLFKLPRSSWDDYDKTLISAGGGVWPRSAKSIPVSAPMRTALGLDAAVTQLSPTELISAILRAPVDLLWNGGIGTYVKAASETHAEVGDRANNAVRINGAELRCKVVGEGGNLGLTQKGRVEAAQHGVLLNTDFIDNSAGVDTSDHEVNIKILLGDAVQRGELDMEARNRLLASMTDEVGHLVLQDNYRQNQALTLMEYQAAKRIGTLGHFIRTLEAKGLLDRQVESLPSDAELAERKARGQGLTRPELAVLLAYDKIDLKRTLLDSDVPEDPYLSQELVRYFPQPLHERFAVHMQRHRLKREIIVTAVTNSTVNRMGATFMLRMQEDTGQTAAAVAKAYTAAREIIDARDTWAAIEALDGKVPESVQVEASLQLWKLLRHMTRWLLNRPAAGFDIAANVARYQDRVRELARLLPGTLTAAGKERFQASEEAWRSRGMPEPLARRLAALAQLRPALDMVEVAERSGRPEAAVAQVFYELGEALDLEWLREQIEALPVEGRWHAQARGSLLDELNHQHRALAQQVLSQPLGEGQTSPVQAWLQRDDPTLRYTRGMLAEILTQHVDYPIASVAVRRLAQLAQVSAG